jgi:signal transduction histidine kinase
VRLSVVNGLDGDGLDGDGLDGDGASVGRPDNTGGYGLTGMRERLRLLAGTLRAGPKENDWTVTAELPLAAAEDGIAR